MDDLSLRAVDWFNGLRAHALRHLGQEINRIKRALANGPPAAERSRLQFDLESCEAALRTVQDPGPVRDAMIKLFVELNGDTAQIVPHLEWFWVLNPE